MSNLGRHHIAMSRIVENASKIFKSVKSVNLGLNSQQTARLANRSRRQKVAKWDQVPPDHVLSAIQGSVWISMEFATQITQRKSVIRMDVTHSVNRMKSMVSVNQLSIQMTAF